MTDATLTLLILGGAVVLFVLNRLPVGVVAVLTALALYLTGVLDADAVLAGFGDPVVIFIATLFIVSEGLDATGVTTWAGRQLTRAGSDRTVLLGALMLLTAPVSAVISPNGAAAALLPVAIMLARRAREMPSRIFIPFAYAAHAGSLLALSGSPVNVIVSDASRDAGGPGFGYFEFAIVGVPLLAVTVIVALIAGRFLLPERISASLPPDFTDHIDVLIKHYELPHGLFRLRVTEGPGAVTVDWDDGDPGENSIELIGVQNDSGHVSEASRLFDVGDVLVVTGPEAQVNRIADEHSLEISTVGIADGTGDALLNRHFGVAEVVIAPRSPLLGETMFPGMMRRGELLILGIRHLGKNRGARATELVEGDTMLIRGPWPAIDELAEDRDILVVDSPDQIRRQTLPLGRRSRRAIAILLGMVVLLATGATAPAIAGLMAAAAMVASRVLSPQQAYRAVSWQTVVLIGGLIPLSTAIEVSGAAASVAEVILGVVGARSPYVLMVALFLLTAGLGQIISNTATVLIVAPIALAAATTTGISVQPILMVVAVAGAASFLTPIATPANMIVMGPGGYRFGDYWRLGITTMGAWLAIALVVIPIAWPF